jgi:hypothetical protein
MNLIIDHGACCQGWCSSALHSQNLNRGIIIPHESKVALARRSTVGIDNDSEFIANPILHAGPLVRVYRIEVLAVTNGGRRFGISHLGSSLADGIRSLDSEFLFGSANFGRIAAISRRKEISYPFESIVEPVTCDDVNFSGLVVPFRRP